MDIPGGRRTAGHTLVVNAIIEQAAADASIRYADLPATPEIVMRAFTAALATRHTFIVDYLLEKYEEVFVFRPTRRHVYEGVASGRHSRRRSKAAVEALTSGHHANTLKLTCACSCLDMCRVFADKDAGVLKANAIYLDKFGPTYPLATAIRACQPTIVRLLLDLHADPDGPRYIHPGTQVPLEEARSARSKVSELLSALLQKGANPCRMSEAASKLLAEQVKRPGYSNPRELLKQNLQHHLVPDEEKAWTWSSLEADKSSMLLEQAKRVSEGVQAYISCLG